MKKIIFFLLTLSVLAFSACTPTSINPPTIPTPPTENDPQKQEIEVKEENPLKYDQMLLTGLNKPFDLKIGQSAQLDIYSGKNFIITPTKVTEDSRCPTAIGVGTMNCYWSGRVVVMLEILELSDIPTTLEISSIKPSTYNELTISLKQVEPAKMIKMDPDMSSEDIPIAPEDYTFSFEIKRTSEL